MKWLILGMVVCALSWLQMPEAKAQTETWTTCANEYQRCSFAGTRTVRYGLDNSWVQKTLKDGVDCNNSVFGDPLRGAYKVCQVLSTATSTTNSTATQWQRCSGEWARCSFSGTRAVRYGLNGVYVTKTFSEGVDCNNNVFGDPLPGADKFCDFAVIPSDTPARQPASTTSTTLQPTSTFKITVEPFASNISQSTAVIQWSLSERATGQVIFGPTQSFGRTSTMEVTFNYSTHIQNLSGLTAGTTYYYYTVSKNAAGQSVSSSVKTFTTTAASVVSTPTTTTTTTTTQLPAQPTPTTTLAPPPTVSGSWSVLQKPPALSNPRRVALSASDMSFRVSYPAYNTSCAGFVYMVNLGDTEDALITMSGSAPLPYPVLVQGGRNVHIRGLDISLQVQPECVAGKVDYGPRMNLHPSAPTSRGLGLQPGGTVFIEGVYIDMKGHDADCMVSNNSSRSSSAQSQSRVIVQNSACHGIEGDSDAGDGSSGEHGDFFQVQGGRLDQLIFENYSAKSSCEGLVVNDFFPLRNVQFRNFDYMPDSRYDDDESLDAYGWGGSLYANGAGSFSMENTFVQYYDPSSSGWVQLSGQHFSNSNPHPGLKFSRPANGDFAPRSRIGIYYQSPHP